jgi:hypothetical protein
MRFLGKFIHRRVGFRPQRTGRRGILYLDTNRIFKLKYPSYCLYIYILYLLDHLCREPRGSASIFIALEFAVVSFFFSSFILHYLHFCSVIGLIHIQYSTYVRLLTLYLEIG